MRSSYHQSWYSCLNSGDTLIVGPGTYTEPLSDYSGDGATPIPSGGGSWATATVVKSSTPLGAVIRLTPGGAWSELVYFDHNDWISIEGFLLDGNFESGRIVMMNDNAGNHAEHIQFKDVTMRYSRDMGVKGSSVTESRFINVSSDQLRKDASRLAPSFAAFVGTYYVWHGRQFL